MLIINSKRSGCKDVFHSYLVENSTYYGKLEMPCVKPVDLEPKSLIPFSKIIYAKDYGSYVHFYEDDYKFEKFWNNPNRYLQILKKFDGVITPDFSLYRDMPLVMQAWNTYRSRSLGHWLQEKGVNVIPNVRFADSRSYEFCCDGICKGSTISIGSHGCLKNRIERGYFKKGVDFVINKLAPNRVIIYGKAPNDIFKVYKDRGIEIFQFDSEYALSRKVEIE